MSIEERIYESQEKYISEKFPKAQTNMGWGVDETDNFISVSTKIYGHGILTSTSTKKGGRWSEIKHTFETEN